MIYEQIHALRTTHSISLMCEVFGVSRSGYYAWLRRPPSRRSQEDARLLAEIQAVHQEGRETYGSPKIHRILRQRGVRCGHKRIVRLMRSADLSAKRIRCYKRTTRANPSHTPAPNRLNQHFAASAPNQVWLADISYIATDEGWLYLAVILDLYSRRIIGWAMDARMTRELVEKALRMALRRRGLDNVPRLHHSDRGSQYTSAGYQTLLRDHKIQVSMSGVGNCYDNAPVESFFSLLKTEEVYHRRYANRQEAKSSLFDYIELFYNRKRAHSSLGDISPATFEANWAAGSSDYPRARDSLRSSLRVAA
ncbi:MAG: IS3 family transposase [Caldilineaceae bacterium]